MSDYFNIRSWEEYTDFMAASKNLIIKRPSKSILVGTKYNRLVEDE